MAVLIIGTKNGVCPLCKSGEEDLPHFLFNCEKLQSIRLVELKKLENSLCSNQLDIFWQIFVSGDPFVKTCLMLGISRDLLSVIPEFDNECDIDLALEIFDSFCKSFLKSAWLFRSSMVE